MRKLPRFVDPAACAAEIKPDQTEETENRPRQEQIINQLENMKDYRG
jgi:hypothetical protein